MPDFGRAMDSLTDTDTLVTLGVATGGYMAPEVVANLVENQAGIKSVPDEAYGLVVFALIEAMPGAIPMYRAAEAGALANTGEAAAERFGVKSTVTSLGGA